MKIRCPKCQTSYTLDDSLLPAEGSVKVQCPSCQARYRVKKKVATPAPVKKETDEPVEQKNAAAETPPSPSPAEVPTPAASPADDPLSGVFGDSDDSVDDLFGSSSSDDDLFAGNSDASPFGGETPPVSDTPSPRDDAVDDLFNDVDDSPPQTSAPVSNIPASDKDSAVDDLFNDQDSADTDDDIPDLFDDIADNDTADEGESTTMMDLDNGRFDSDTDADDLFSDIADGPELDDPLTSSPDTVVHDPTMASGLDLKPGDGIDTLFDDIPDDAVAAADPDTLFSDEEDRLESDEKTQIIGGEAKESVAQSRTPRPQKAHLNSAADIGRGRSAQQSGDALFSDVSFDMFDKPADTGESLFSTHTELPDIEKKDTGTVTKIPVKRDRMYAILLALKIAVVLVVFGLMGFGGWYYYVNYYSGKSSDVYKKISESITEQTGTLSDVRAFLMKDSLTGYEKAAGILQQYMKNEEVAPSVVGLDVQVQLNVLYSYSRRRDSLKLLEQRLQKALKETPDNFDLIKAQAFYDVITKQYEAAAKLLQSHVKDKDTEVLYILGVAAMEQKLYKEANHLFFTAFSVSDGKNTKAGYTLALSNYKMGNAKTAIAFLNKIIRKNTGYIKAYILKADILVKKYGKRKKALHLLTSIDSADLSALSARDQAAYYEMLAHLYYILDDVKSAKKQYDKVLELEPRSVKYLLKVADFLKATGDASAALNHYKTVIAIDSNNVEAIIGRAESNALLGQLSKVRNGLFRISQDKVDDPVLLTRIGVLLVSLGTDVDSVNALVYFDKAIEKDTSYVEAYLSKIFVLLELDKVDDARNYVAKLKKLKLDSFQYHLAAGIINHHDGEYEKAQKQFKEALALNRNDDPRVFYHYGVLLYDQQKYQGAIKYLNRALRISPENFPYRLALGRAYFAVKKYKNVIKTLKRTKYEEQKQYKALQLLADSEYRQKHYKKALVYINRGLELYGRSVLIYYTKAKILYAMRDFNAAQKAVDTALLVDMTDADSYLLYAKIFISTGDYKSAMDKINAAERIDNTNPRLYLLKGIVAKNLDDYYQALKYFKNISKYPVLQREAYQEIAECYEALGKQRKAMKYFKKAAKQGNPKAMSYLAALYYDKGDLKNALVYYRRSYAKDKKNMETIKRLAYIYKEKEQFVKALGFFQRYKKLMGDESDPGEEEMIDDEIYFLQQNMPKQQFRKMVEHPEQYNDEGVSKATIAKAKKLYMKARALKKTDPNQAKALFREVMTLVPKTNRYYRKAFKQFSKIK